MESFYEISDVARGALVDATQKSGGKVSTNARAFQARFEIRTKILSYFQILVEINSPEYQEMPKHN
jgi:hypothetical protein